ncbi:MAG: MgtC/SapB family protein [Bacteroidetes bacterium]|nr:MgtC/SapB family protein [Bacteroidota bacterium]
MEFTATKFSDLSIDHLTGLVISIGIGFLIGMERQFSKEVSEHEDQFAGIRTFTMVSMFGFIAAIFSSIMGIWIFGATLVCVLPL